MTKTPYNVKIPDWIMSSEIIGSMVFLCMNEQRIN